MYLASSEVLWLNKPSHVFRTLSTSLRLFSAKDYKYTEELRMFWESLSDLFKLSVQKNHFALACEWLCNSWECKIPSTSEGIHIASPGFPQYCWIYPETGLWSPVPPCLWQSEGSAEWDVHRQQQKSNTAKKKKKVFFLQSLLNSSIWPLTSLLKDIKQYKVKRQLMNRIGAKVTDGIFMWWPVH